LMVTLGNFEPKTSSTIPKSTLNSAKNSSLFVAEFPVLGHSKCGFNGNIFGL
jgi:hypothetical protein